MNMTTTKKYNYQYLIHMTNDMGEKLKSLANNDDDSIARIIRRFINAGLNKMHARAPIDIGACAETNHDELNEALNE